MEEFKEKGAFSRQIFAEYSPSARNLRIAEYFESKFVGGKKPWA